MWDARCYVVMLGRGLGGCVTNVTMVGPNDHCQNRSNGLWLVK